MVTHVDLRFLVLNGPYKVAGWDNAEGLAGLDVCRSATRVIFLLLLWRDNTVRGRRTQKILRS